MADATKHIVTLKVLSWFVFAKLCLVIPPIIENVRLERVLVGVGILLFVTLRLIINRVSPQPCISSRIFIVSFIPIVLLAATAADIALWGSPELYSSVFDVYVYAMFAYFLGLGIAFDLTVANQKPTC
jgi:hypothetical protein